MFAGLWIASWGATVSTVKFLFAALALFPDKGEAFDLIYAPRLKRVIRDGLPGTTMPAWKLVLNESQINAVITYVSRAFHPLPEEARPR